MKKKRQGLFKAMENFLKKNKEEKKEKEEKIRLVQDMRKMIKDEVKDILKEM